MILDFGFVLFSDLRTKVNELKYPQSLDWSHSLGKEASQRTRGFLTPEKC